MEMHNIKDNPDAMKEIAKEMKKAAKKRRIVEPVDCWFGETLVTFTKIIINERAYFYITPKNQQLFTVGYYSIRSDVHLRKTNSPYAAYLINELIEIVKSGDFSFC